MKVFLVSLVFSGMVIGGISRKIADHFRPQTLQVSRDTSAKTRLGREDSIALQKPFTFNESVDAQVAYMRNCQFCHGADRMGANAPSLYKIKERVNFLYFKNILTDGRAQMPAFRTLEKGTVVALYKYLSDQPVNNIPRKRQ